MTEAEALDEAAKAIGWLHWDDACRRAEFVETEGIRVHAATLMENAALEANLADVSKALMATAEAAASSTKKAVEAEAKLAVARKAMTAMHKDLLLRAEIDIRDGTKIVHASNGVWLKFCAALKEIDNATSD